MSGPQNWFPPTDPRNPGYQFRGLIIPKDNCRRCAEQFDSSKLNDKKWCVTCELLDRVTDLEIETKILRERIDSVAAVPRK